MRRLCTYLAVGVLLFVAGTGAAWAGTDCGSATPIGEGMTTGDLGGAPEAWFSFTASSGGVIHISTAHGGTVFDTTLAVFEVCGGAPIVENDGNFPGRPNRAIASLAGQAGHDYLIRLGGVDTGAGTAFEMGVLMLPNLGGCGVGGTGDCYLANGSPFCEDSCGGIGCPSCCDTVCAADDFCCTTEWDQICADAAVQVCVLVPVELQKFDVGLR